ncbi:MAG: hypothetical protein EBT39_03915 [Sphingobacteriia bacterium]|uniref:Uncharacterized protein n=1 Tax=viral metagenome TaxID=1070528 RepID=A0A6C0I1K2_9ZZZZ|nr:hypothetical protein [Candidatus Fonsibacter lacus]
MISEITKEKAMATLTTSNITTNGLKREIEGIKKEISDLKEENTYFKEMDNYLNKAIATNNKNNKERLENIKIVLLQLAACNISLKAEDLESMQILNTVLSEDLTNAQILQQNNREMEAEISKIEELIKKNELLIYNKKLLVEETEQELCKHLIIKIKQAIVAFNNGDGGVVSTFLTDKDYKRPPSDSEDKCALSICIIEYREKVIKLLGPLIQSTVFDVRTEHSRSDSPYCNGLQGVQQDIELILSSILEILSLIDIYGDKITSTLQIDTKYPYMSFFDSLSELVDKASCENPQYLYNINPRAFFDVKCSRWDTIRRYDNYGDIECVYSYDSRIKKAFGYALPVLIEFAKIGFLSESRKGILGFTTAIKAIKAIKATTAPTAPTTSSTRQFFKYCASTLPYSIGFSWKMHLCSFLGNKPPNAKERKYIPKEDN